MRIALRIAIILGLLALLLALVVVSREDPLSLESLQLPAPQPWARIEKVELLDGHAVRVTGRVEQASPGGRVLAFGFSRFGVGPGREATIGAAGSFSVLYEFGNDAARPSPTNLLSLEHGGKRQYIRVDWSKREWVDVR